MMQDIHDKLKQVREALATATEAEKGALQEKMDALLLELNNVAPTPVADDDSAEAYFDNMPV